MGKILKKNSGVFYWIVLPCLILVASIFAVNVIPRPAISLYGSSGCNTTSDATSNDANCNDTPTNICVQEFCDLGGPAQASICDIVDYDIGTATICQCGTCGNGRCEMALGEGQFETNPPGATQGQVINVTCPEDCLTNNFRGGAWAGDDLLRDDHVCLNLSDGGPGSPFIVPCGQDLLKQQTPINNVGAALDGCCPAGCQGTDSASAATFDADCAPNFDGTQCLDLCGNGVIDTGEECDPEASQTNCLSDETCNAVTCQCQSALPTPVISPFPPPGTNLEGSGILSCSLQRGTALGAVQGLASLLGLGVGLGALIMARRRSA
jgi:hypothetical protein